MKLRPQINGPIDVGHGNYILTSPADRNGRREDEAPVGGGGADPGPEAVNGGGGGGGGGAKANANGQTSRSMRMLDGRYDVSDLLSSANTLTQPNNSKRRNEL